MEPNRKRFAWLGGCLILALAAVFVAALVLPDFGVTVRPTRPVVVSATFTSDPSNAAVYVNEVLVGTTPLTVELETGMHPYRVVAQEPIEAYDLYKPFFGTLDAEDDTAVDIWIPRTTAEEQAQATAAYEAQREREEAQRLVAAVRASPWTYRSSVDSMTDQDRSSVSTPATSWPEYYDDARLVIICYAGHWSASDGIGIILDADTYLGRDDLTVDWRVDGDPSIAGQAWRADTEGTALWNLSYKTQLLRSLDGARQLTIRAYDYKDTPHTYTFNVLGVREAVELLGCYSGSAFD